MADGSHKKIEDIKVGEKVLATDPITGKSAERPVTATIVTEGTKHLTELTIATSQGAKPLTATDGHRFWVTSEHKWVNMPYARPGFVHVLDVTSEHKWVNMVPSNLA
jgi:Pretoxin HINT domain